MNVSLPTAGNVTLNVIDNLGPRLKEQRHIIVQTVENGWALSLLPNHNSPFAMPALLQVAETPARLAEIITEWAQGHRAASPEEAAPPPPAGELGA